MSAIALKLAAMAVSYLLPEVLDKIRGHWWGRLALWWAGRKATPADAALLQRLEQLEQLTAEQRARLTPSEQAAIDHTDSTDAPPPAPVQADNSDAPA